MTATVLNVPMPWRIARLERDARGYPIPWNVERLNDGSPIFVANNAVQHRTAIKKKLCPTCGLKLDSWKWFVGGPLSAFHAKGAYFDLPMHLECATYALQVCPWLAAPRYMARVDRILAKQAVLREDHKIGIDDTQIPDRPELFVAVESRRFTTEDRGYSVPVVMPGRPYRGIQYWRAGQQLTPEEGERTVRGIMNDEDWQP